MTALDADTGRSNRLWTRTLVDELSRAGVRHVCLSPGARSAPLTLAVAENSDLTTSVHVDERSAAFFALGYGQASGVPAALVCTSGTAAANYLPAIIEAHYGRVPLVALTADRPHELRDTGAWQAIDQIKLYGRYVRWFAELPTPSDAPEMLRYARSVAARAVAEAHGPPSGPVHVNVPIREPLMPGVESEPGGAPDQAAFSGRADGTPWVTVPPTSTYARPELLDGLAERILREPRGLILAGPCRPTSEYATAVARLAAASGYPVLAEPAGGLRYGSHDRSRVVTGYDAFLRSERWADAHEPDLVLRFGQSLTWKYVAGYLERHPDARQVVVDPQLTWDDPTRMAAERLRVDPVPLCHALTDRLVVLGPRDRSVAVEGDRWFAAWRQASDVVSHTVGRLADASESGTVVGIYRALLDVLPDGALVHAANSMAVRDLDTFSPTLDRHIRVAVNRGAAGIDGTVSSALGAALATGAPTVLLTGDLAFVHDLNGLGAARMPGITVVIVVLNDGGGGIFAHLPITDLAPEVFERYFLAPSGVALDAACAAYRVPHATAADTAAFVAAIERALGETGVRVIEVPIDLEANTAIHRELWSTVAEALT